LATLYYRQAAYEEQLRVIDASLIEHSEQLGELHSRIESLEAGQRLLPEILERLGPQTLSPEHQAQYSRGKLPSSHGLVRKTKSLRKRCGKRPGDRVGHRNETLRLVALSCLRLTRYLPRDVTVSCHSRRHRRLWRLDHPAERSGRPAISAYSFAGR
jgi:hypothetical protein